MDVDIRPCRAGDAGLLGLVGRATFLESYAGVLPVADILAHCEHQHDPARYEAWLTSPGHRLWLAEATIGSAPVGYAMLSPPDLPVALQAGDVEVKRIYVLYRCHGAAVGARLMAAAIQDAQAVGARRMLLGVKKDNALALAFYARQGFETIGVRRFRIGANEYDDLVLARALGD
jgi:ribosomal protein S18 acetylase RimI-like enzyme